MTISATTQGLRQGVCTSSNRPATPFEGQMIYETDTDLTYIYGGSAWQQVSGGTAVGNSGLVYVKSQTVGSGVTSVTVSDAFNSTYADYRVVISGVSFSSADADVRVKFEAALSTYNWAGTYQLYTNPTVITGTGASSSSGGIAIGASETSGNFSCAFDVQRPALSSFTVVTGTHANDSYRTTYSGCMNTATAYTDLIINVSGGTMTGGTITVYGYRKA